MKNKFLLNSVLSISLFMAGCSQPQNKEQPEIYNVSTQKLSFVDQNENGSYIGTIEPSVTIPLSFLMSGLVISVNASEGESVKKGQLLAVLDSSSAFNTLKIAEAKENQAQDAYNRLESVHKNGSLTEIKWVEIQTGLDQAQSMKLLAQKNYKDCRLYAPTDGYISRRSIEPGMSAAPGLPVFNLVKIEKVFVTIPVPENEISKIKKDQKAVIKISALSDEHFLGTVEEIGVVADLVSHTYSIKIAVNNDELNLKPGMVGNVNLKGNSQMKCPIVPLKAVLTDETNTKYLYIAGINNKAVKKIVKLGKLLNDGVVIVEGLNHDDEIIVDGNHKLAENSPINIINIVK